MQLIPWRFGHVRSPRAQSALESDPFHTDIDRMFQRFFQDFEAPTRAADIGVPVDVNETDAGYQFRVELPGLEPNELEITLQDGVLTISGEKHDSAAREGENWHVRERRFGKFQRSFTLPVPVDESSVRAEHKNGVLTIDLAKVEPKKPRKIEIKAV